MSAPTMTAAGVVLRTYGDQSTVTVAIGDRVLLWNGWTGTAHSWTQRGVAVVIEAEREAKWFGVRVWAVDCGDGDIVAKLPT